MHTPSASHNLSIAQALAQQLQAIQAAWPTPRVRRLHLPRRTGAPGEHDAEFCAIELDDGSFGLSYVLLGHTLDALLAANDTGALPLAGSDPMAWARQLGTGDGVTRALALAAINAMTDSVWRRIGYEPPPAGNSLGDIELTAQDHLGMIGFFPPLVRRVAEAGGRLSVVELDERMVMRQRERFPGVSIGLDHALLSRCNRVVGTSTMLLNDTLDAMLAAAPLATDFAVIGPSAGLWPDALFDRGVTLLGGTRVTDGPAFTQALAEGASWTSSTRKFAIARDRWPGCQALVCPI